LVNYFGVPDPSSTLIRIVAWTTLKLSFLSQEKQRFLSQQVRFFFVVISKLNFFG